MTDHLHALAMRTKASNLAARSATPIGCAKVPFEIATAILALPLEADHAALVAEAVKLPEIAALIKALRGALPVMAESGSYPNMPHFNAVKALAALETP